MCGPCPFRLDSPRMELVTAGLDLPPPSLTWPRCRDAGKKCQDLTLPGDPLTSTHSLG